MMIVVIIYAVLLLILIAAAADADYAVLPWPHRMMHYKRLHDIAC